MGGPSRITWTLTSSDSLSLPFPYSGPNLGYLTVRKKGKQAAEAIFAVEKGQIPCSESDPCRIKIRFDDAPSTVFLAGPAASGRSTIVFLHDSARFVRLAQKASRILVQVMYYQAGEQILTFNADTPLRMQQP